MLNLFSLKRIEDGRIKVYFLGIQVFVSPHLISSPFSTQFQCLSLIGTHIGDCRRVMA